MNPIEIESEFNPNLANSFSHNAPDSESLSLEMRKTSFAAIGMWTDMSVRLLSLPNLNEIVKQPLGGDTQARSIITLSMETKTYLFVGLGDGSLVSFHLFLSSSKDANKLEENKGMDIEI